MRYFCAVLLMLSSISSWGGPAALKPKAKPAASKQSPRSAPAAKPAQPVRASQGARPVPAGSAVPRQPASTNSNLPAVADRSTSIDFEDDIIEGMNKNPFDSLTRVGRQDGAGGGALYRRKRGFGREIKQTVREMGFAP